MNRSGCSMMEVGDWVAIQNNGNVRMGHIAQVENDQCVIAVVNLSSQGYEASGEMLTAPPAALSALGVGRWLLVSVGGTIDEVG